MRSTIDTNEGRERWSSFSLALLFIVPMLAVPAMGQGTYTITQITTGTINHEWPSMNDSGTIVWSQQEPGSCSGGQCWQVFEQVLNGQPQQITSDAHNHSYPAIDNNGDIMYLKDGEGAGPGLEVVDLVSGVENQIEFSSGSPPGCTEPPAGPANCNSWRTAGQYFGIGDGNGQIVSYHDFCPSNPCTPTRTFDVSGFGVFTALPATAVALDINANGDIAYDDGTGTIYEVNLTSQLPIKVAPGTLPRINDLGDIVVVAKGQVQVWFHPDYTQHAVVNSTTTAIWADINNAGTVALEDIDGSGYHQVYQATPATVTLLPSSLTFAAQPVGTTSATQPLTLTNAGTSTLEITSVGITGTNNGDFAQTNTCGASLPAGSNCAISVTFTPTAPGTRTASVSVTDSAPGSPQTAALTGTGTSCPPLISNISVSNIMASSANVNWTTDTAANSTVNYGTTSSYGFTASDPTNVTTHLIGLAGLMANTLYHYQVKSVASGCGTPGVSSDQTFMTTSGMPTIQLTADNTTPVPSVLTDPYLTQPSCINLTATLGQGQADGQVDFSAQVKDLKASAGHDHTDTTGVLIGAFGTGGASCSQPPLPLVTSPVTTCNTSGGTCTVPLTVSEVSGSFSATAKIDQDPTVSSTLPKLTVEIQALQALSNGTMYVLDGQIPGKHVLTHTATPTLNVNVQTVAGMYFNNGSTSGQRIGVNDMSLPLGGLFDYKGTWNVPHQLHRIGDSVDIDHNTYKGSQRPAVMLPLLKTFMTGVNMTQICEPLCTIAYPIHFQVNGQPKELPTSDTSIVDVPRVSDASVTAKVEASLDGLLSYTYSVSDASQSEASIATVSLDVSKAQNTAVLSEAGIVQGAGSVVDYERAILGRPSSIPVIPVGLTSPPDWVGMVSVDGFVLWGADTGANFVEPSREVTGYQVVSPGLPGIRQFKVSPYIDPGTLGLIPPSSDADALRYESQLHLIENAVSHSGYTVGPTAPPASFDALQFLETIRGYKNTAEKLGWIHDSALSGSLEIALSTADDMIARGNNVGARQALNRLLATLDSSAAGLSSEADALLRFNIEYLLKQIG